MNSGENILKNLSPKTVEEIEGLAKLVLAEYKKLNSPKDIILSGMYSEFVSQYINIKYGRNSIFIGGDLLQNPAYKPFDLNEYYLEISS